MQLVYTIWKLFYCTKHHGAACREALHGTPSQRTLPPFYSTSTAVAHTVYVNTVCTNRAGHAGALNPGPASLQPRTSAICPSSQSAPVDREALRAASAVTAFPGLGWACEFPLTARPLQSLSQTWDSKQPVMFASSPPIFCPCRDHGGLGLSEALGNNVAGFLIYCYVFLYIRP